MGLNFWKRALTAALCSAAAAMSLATPGAARAEDKVTLRLDWVNSGYHAIWYYGIDKGIFKNAATLSHRFQGSGWLLLSGVIDILLGVLIWTGLPYSTLTIIGLLVGISMMFRGISWLMLGFTVKQIPKTAAGPSLGV